VRAIHVRLTKEQVRNSPAVDSQRPLSRERERELARHYAWPEWWGVGGPMVPPAPPELRTADTHPPVAAPVDPHLRSFRDVVGYAAAAVGGERVGKVRDLIAETEGWVVRYVVVDARLWRPGGEVLVSPAWVERVDWKDGVLVTDLSAEQLRSCPSYASSDPVNRQHEEKLYDFLGRPRYWS
jgi:hypothetical protein